MNTFKEMMRAPTLFAFVCTKPVLIPMEAKVSKIMTTDNAPLLSDGMYLTKQKLSLIRKEFVKKGLSELC